MIGCGEDGGSADQGGECTAADFSEGMFRIVVDLLEVVRSKRMRSSGFN